MKDGRTHLAYKAEHVVDLESDLVLAAEIRPATDADTETLVDSVMQAQVNLEAAGSERQIEEVAADKGYHAADTMELCEFLDLRTYIPEPQRKHERALDRQAGGVSTGGVRQSPSEAAQQRQATAAAAQRTLRADLRPRLRHGRQRRSPGCAVW